MSESSHDENDPENDKESDLSVFEEALDEIENKLRIERAEVIILGRLVTRYGDIIIEDPGQFITDKISWLEDKLEVKPEVDWNTSINQFVYFEPYQLDYLSRLSTPNLGIIKEFLEQHRDNFIKKAKEGKDTLKKYLSDLQEEIEIQLE